MSKIFKKILVPVDFTERTAPAVRKGVHLIDPEQGHICLLYICKPLFSLNMFFDTGYFVAPPSEILTNSEIGQGFSKYVAMITQKAPQIKIDTIVSKAGRFQHKIEEAALGFGPDLIIVSDSTDRRYLFSGSVSLRDIAKNTRCAVLNLGDFSEA